MRSVCVVFSFKDKENPLWIRERSIHIPFSLRLFHKPTQ